MFELRHHTTTTVGCYLSGALRFSGMVFRLVSACASEVFDIGLSVRFRVLGKDVLGSSMSANNAV